jgi:hypothetical protein
VPDAAERRAEQKLHAEEVCGLLLGATCMEKLSFNEPLDFFYDTEGAKSQVSASGSAPRVESVQELLARLCCLCVGERRAVTVARSARNTCSIAESRICCADPSTVRAGSGVPSAGFHVA